MSGKEKWGSWCAATVDPKWVRCVKKEWLLPFQLHGLIERSTQWLLLVVVVVVVVEAVFLEQRILRCPLGSFSEADWQEVDFSWGEAGCQSASVIKREQVLRWTEPTAVQAAFSGVHMLHVLHFPFSALAYEGSTFSSNACLKLKFFFEKFHRGRGAGRSLLLLLLSLWAEEGRAGHAWKSNFRAHHCTRWPSQTLWSSCSPVFLNHRPDDLFANRKKRNAWLSVALQGLPFGFRHRFHGDLAANCTLSYCLIS